MTENISHNFRTYALDNKISCLCFLPCIIPSQRQCLSLTKEGTVKEGGKQDWGENLIDNLDSFLTALFLSCMLRKGNHVGESQEA